MKTCKNCGEINASDTAFCVNCGSSNFVMQEETVCPHCGAVNDSSSTHCTNCGNDLGASKSVAENNAPQPVGVSSGSSDVVVIETSKCPNCGTEIALTSMFCYKCGTNVSAVHEHKVVQRKICPHCGRPNPQESHYCTFCYCSLADAKTENLQVVHDHSVLEEGAVRQVFLESMSGKTIVCTNCGALNKPNEAFCVNCGLKLVVEEPKKYCPECGAENAIDAKHCTTCNFAFEQSQPEDLDKWTCKHCGCDNEQDSVYCSTCGRKRKK